MHVKEKKPKRDPVMARRVKEHLEEIWNKETLTSPLLKALWTTTRDGAIERRKSKEKIREYCREE